jgi:hypothetical protein
VHIAEGKALAAGAAATGAGSSAARAVVGSEEINVEISATLRKVARRAERFKRKMFMVWFLVGTGLRVPVARA